MEGEVTTATVNRGLTRADDFFVPCSGEKLTLKIAGDKQIFFEIDFDGLSLCFRFLKIDPKAWSGLEETAASSTAKTHIGAVRLPLRSFFIVFSVFRIFHAVRMIASLFC